MRPIQFLLASSFVVVLAGCPKEKADGPMTQAEARESLDESTLDSQAAALTTSSVEIGRRSPSATRR